jgi:hypothetical protein
MERRLFDDDAENDEVPFEPNQEYQYQQQTGYDETNEMEQNQEYQQQQLEENKESPVEHEEEKVEQPIT